MPPGRTVSRALCSSQRAEHHAVPLTRLPSGLRQAQNRGSSTSSREDQSDGRESQAEVLGMGLRGPGADSRTAKAHGRADGQAIRAGPLEITPPPKESDLNLRAPRVKPPAALEAICSTATHERAGHTYGKGSRDIRRAYRRDYPNPIDVVAFPRDEKELVRVLEWCDGANIAAVPYGGGSSVVGGVEPPEGDRYRGAVSIDLMHLDKVVEVDKVSRAARIQRACMVPRSTRS